MAIGKEAQQAIASAKATEAKKTPTNTAAMMAQQQGQRTNTYLDTAAKSRAANPVSVNALGAWEREPKVESKANINVKNIVDNVAKMFTSPAKTETTTPKTNFWVGNNTSAQMAAQQGKNKNNYLDQAQSVRNATANVWTPSKNAPTSVKAAYEQGQNTNKYLNAKQQNRYAADIAQERGKAKTNYFTPQNTWTDPRDAIIDMNSDMDAADKAKAALEWAETGTTTMSAYKNDAEVKEAGEQIRNLWASGTNADAWFGKDRELVIRQGEESKNQNWWYMNTKDGKDFSNPAAVAKNQDRVVDWMNNINGYMYGGNYNDHDNYRIGWDLKDIYDAIDKGIVPDFELNMEDGNTMSAKDWVKSKQEEWSELSYQIRLDNDYVDYINGQNRNATTTTRKIGEIDDLIRQAGDNQAHVDRLNELREALEKSRDADYWREMQNAALVEASLDEQEKKAKQQQENEYKSMFGGVPTLDETESEKALAKIKEQREALEKRKAELTEEYESWHMTPEVAEAIARLSDKHAYDAISRQGGIMAAQEAHDADQAAVDAWRAGINLGAKSYNFSDRMAGSIESGVQGILGGLSGAAAAVASAVVDAANADWEATWNGEVLDLIRTDDRQAVIQARNTFDSYFGEGAYEKTFGNSMKIQTAEEEIARLEEENAKLVGDIPGFDPISGETLASVNANEKKIKELEKQIKDWKAADVKAGISDKPVEAYFQNHADEYDEKSQAAIAKALNGAGKVESYFIKGGKTLTEMGFDMAVGAITGGGSLASMWLRVFGQEASAARRDGATIYQQLAYGGAKAGIELLTEKVFGVFDNIGYGKGIAAEASEKLVAALADTPFGMTIVRGLVNAGEEGLEELLSDLLAPVADKIYKEGSLKDLAAEELANGLEDFILGAAMGALGFTGGIFTRQNNALNTERYERDLTNDIIRNTDPENLTAVSRAVNKVQQAKNSGNSNVAPENQLTREEYAAAKQLGLITPDNEKAISPSKGSLFTDARGRIHINSSNSRPNTTSDDRRDVVIANAAREGVGLNPVEETSAPTREEQIQAEQDKAIEAEEAARAAAEEEYQAEQEARLAGIEEDNRREEESKYTDENDMSKPEPEEDVSDEELAQIRHDVSEEEYLDSLGTKEKTEEPATASETAQGEARGSTPTEIAPEVQESVKPNTAPATQPTPVSRAAQNAKATVENTQQAIGTQSQTQANAAENSSSTTTAMPTTEEVREAERKIKSGETNEKTVAEIVPDVDPFVSSREPVKTIDKNAFAKTGEPNEPTLRQKVWNFFKSHFNGVIRDAKAGPVIINERGIRNDIAHGVGEAKAATFEAVPDVLRSGDIVSRSTGGENGKSYMIAGKVMLNGAPVNVYCVIKENGVGTNKFYLHEVSDGQGNLYYQINQNKEAPSAFQDSTPQQQGSADKASMSNVPQIKQSSKSETSTAQPQSGTIEAQKRSESNAEKATTTANTTATELGANRGRRELRSGERANDQGSGKGNARLASRAPRFTGVNAKETRQKWREFASKIEEAGGRILSAKEYSKAVKKYVGKFKNMFGVPVTVYNSSGMGENAPVGLTTKTNPEIGTFIGVNHAKMRRVNGGIANGPGTALFHEYSHQAWSNYKGEATPKSMVTTALKNAKVSKVDAVAALYDVLEAYGFRYIQQKGLQNALGIKSKEDWTKLTDQERVNKLNQFPAKMREEIVGRLYEELGNFLITGDVRLKRYNSFKNAAEEAQKEAVNIGLYSKIGLDFMAENARDFDEAAMQEKEAQEAQADIKKAVNSAKPVSEFDPSDDFAVYSLPSSDDFEKDLVAVRNTSLSSAIRAVKDGGIAMGSIAIAKKTRGHSSFGEVSILFNRDTIDPDKNSNNNVYSVDAYTPVHPKKISKFSGDEKSLYEYIERLANEFLGSEVYMTQYDDPRTAFFADSYNKDLILAAIASDAKYSLDDLIIEAEKNEPVESKDLKDKLSKITPYKTAFDIRRFTEDYSEEYGFSESGYDIISKETGELLLRITFDDRSGEFSPYFDMDDDMRDSTRELLDKLTDLYIKGVSEEEAKISGAEYIATAELWQALESAAAYQGTNDIISEVKSSDKTKNSPEFAALRRKLLYSAIPYNIISPWVDNVIGKFGEYKTGYQRKNGEIVDATLENALEIMRESPRRQSGTFFDNFDSDISSDVSVDDLHTIVSHWFGSFAELKNTEHILTNDREYVSYDKVEKNLSALRKTLTEGFSEVQNNNSNERSKDFSSITSDFYDREIARESANLFLYDIAHYLEGIKGIRSLTDTKLRSEIAKRLDEYGWSETREGTSYQKAGDIIKVFNEIAELPTGYFEAKPNRVITKDEYAVFLVPKDEETAHYRHEETSGYNKQLQELKTLLDSEGIPYIEYDNDHTRRDIMANDLDNIDGVVFEEPYTEEDNSTVNSDLKAENEALKQRIAELEAQQQQPEESRPQPSTRKKPQQQSLKEDTQTKGSIRNSEERARDIAEEFGLSDGTYQSATRKEVSRIADYCIEKYGMENEWDRLMNKKTWDRVDFSEAGKIVLEMTKNLNRDMTRDGNRGLGKVIEKKAGETYEQYRNRQETEDKRAYQERREPIDALLQQYADQKSTRGQELQETYNFTFADELRMRASHRFLNYSRDGEVRNATDYAKSAKMWAIIDDLVTRVENAEESGSARDLVEITKMVGRIRGRENLLGKTGTKAENWMFDRMLKLGVEKDALAALAYGNIGKIMDDLTPITYADAIQTVRVTNMLSNIATGLNNLANNAISLRTQSLAQNASIPFAKAFEKLTGKKIAISDSSVFRGKDIRRAEEAALEYSILSSYYGMASEDGRVDLDNKGTNFYVNGTGLSGMAARALARYNFLVQAFVLNPDAPAKARARLGLQKGIEKAFEGAENTPETIRNRKELEGYAAKETNRRVLQEDNAITNAVLYFKNHLLNKAKTPGEHVKVGGRELGSFKLGDFVMAFAKVPTNVGIQKLESTPYGALYQTIRYAGALAKAKANPESLTTNEMARISRDIGRAATTAGMIGLGALAAMTGALKNFDDTDDDEEKKLAREKGYSGLMLNLSQIFHGGEWRDDDLIVSGNFLEILATPLTIGAMMYDASKEGMGFLNSMAYGTKKSFTGMVDAVMDIPGLQQIGDLWTSYANQKPDDGDFDKAMKAIGQFAVSSGTSYFIPNLVAQATAGADNKQRDIYTTDSYAETLRNIVMAKTPGLRKMLPEKTDTLGNTRMYGETKLSGILNTVVFPGDFKRYHVSEVEKEMMRLTNGGYGKNWFDTSGPKKIEVDGQDYMLTADQRRAYHETKSHNLLAAYDAFRTSDEYKDLSWEQRAEVYKQLKTNAEHITKDDWMKASEIPGEVKYQSWEEKLDSLDDKIHYLSEKQKLDSIYTKDDEGSKVVRDYDALDKFIQNDYQKFSDVEKELIDGSYGSLDKMSEAWTEAKIDSKLYTDMKAAVNNEIEGVEGFKGPEYMANALAKIEELTNDPKQLQFAHDKMKYFNNIPADTRTLDNLTEAGITTKNAAEYITDNAHTENAPGYDEIQNGDKYNNIATGQYYNEAGKPLTGQALEDCRWEMIMQVLPDGTSPKSQRQRMIACRDRGMTVQQALDAVTDSLGNPLSTIYMHPEDADGNALVDKKGNKVKEVYKAS